MEIVKATAERRDEIKSLLQSQNLPSEDLPIELTYFYTALEEEKVIGLIGMEKYGHYGLLRSMIVHPEYRNKRIAETLVTMLEQQAAAENITAMFLLTETAESYFRKKGYDIITRNKVPEELMISTEFSHVCPVNAMVMRKQIQRSKV